MNCYPNGARFEPDAMSEVGPLTALRIRRRGYVRAGAEPLRAGAGAVRAGGGAVRGGAEAFAALVEPFEEPERRCSRRWRRRSSLGGC